MTEYIEIALRWILSLQLIFWGLNGFFHWIKITPAAEPIEQFVAACIKVKFIMPTVKSFEIFFGFCLLTNSIVPISLLALSPILFVITGLHTLHNPRPWSILLSYTFPYCALLILNSQTLLRLFAHHS
ncbi:MAG: hypothetical protein ACXVCY_10875 [Pseudobdellovibrionaceae bacterium]